ALNPGSGRMCSSNTRMRPRVRDSRDDSSSWPCKGPEPVSGAQILDRVVFECARRPWSARSHDFGIGLGGRVVYPFLAWIYTFGLALYFFQSREFLANLPISPRALTIALLAIGLPFLYWFFEVYEPSRPFLRLHDDGISFRRGLFTKSFAFRELR